MGKKEEVIVDRQSVPIVIDDGEPVAIVYLNRNRDRVIYSLEKANEDRIVELLSNNSLI